MTPRPRPVLARVLMTALLVTFAAPPLAGEAWAQKPWERRGAKSWIKIDSSPQQAAIYLESKEHGIIGYTPHKMRVTRGSYKIILELPGYQPLERQITVGRRNDPFIFVLERAPKPAVLDIRAAGHDDSALGGALTVDNVAVGTVPNSVTVKAGRHQVLVNKDGYLPYSEWLDLAEGERRTVVVVLTRRAPELGTVVITADVAQAETWVDGQKRDDPPCILQLPAGPHTVEVRSGTLQPFRQAVNVVGGQQVKVMATLAAQIPSTGGLRVHTPGVTGAEILVDGEPKGRAPAEVGNLRPGTHILEIRLKGYRTFEKEITVKAGDTLYVRAEMEAMPEAKPVGKLVVKSAVPKAEVFIDGASYGQAPVQREVPPGHYIVVVQKKGYPEFRREVDLGQGKVVEVVADMKPVGRLMVLAPPGASVLIDGQIVGRTPMAPTEVGIGEHILEVRHANYLEHRQPIRIEGGKSANFEIELKPRPTGPSPEEVAKLRQGLSSFGVIVIPPGTFTADVGFGFPYLFEGRMTVGALRAGQFGLDAGVAFRTFGQANEVLAHGRVMFLRAGPVGLGGDFAIGGGGSSDGRNSFTMQFGLGFSLHFKNMATFTGRGYADIYSDRMCHSKDALPEDMNGDRDVCRIYDPNPTTPVPDEIKSEVQTFARDRLGETNPEAWDPRDHRLTGTRFMLQAALEVAVAPQTGVYVIVEGAPFQDERGAYMDLWNSIMAKRDPLVYVRGGLTFKF